jgi:gamma-glutamyltranspeptidase/glutathione hydrolase
LTCQYRGVTLYECPPNGQGLAAILALNLARGFELGAMDEGSRLHAMIECMRLGFADAQRYVCDPDFVKLPLDALCGDLYTEQRRALITERAAEKVEAGDPLASSDTAYLSVVDGEGNACSLIQSNYMGMGTGLVVPGTGVSLQNRGALFSLDDEHPNCLAPGKRPYHTIIPAMTTREGALHACFGVMGGHMQPQAHMQVLVNMLDLGMNPQQALDAPRWQLNASESGLGAGEQGGLVLIEEGFTEQTKQTLAHCGHKLKELGGFERIHFGGGQVILKQDGLLVAGSDSRKDGCAAGW